MLAFVLSLFLTSDFRESLGNYLELAESRREENFELENGD